MSDQPLFSIVTTTINVPTLLRDYAEDAVRHDRTVEQMIVVGDRKTPTDVPAFCDELQRETGVTCRYVSVEDQERYLERWPAFAEFLPWNCIQRRNVGLLLAYEGDADVVVTIDDDNFLEQEDYLGRHAHVGQRIEVDAVSTASGWWNVCELLQEAQGVPFYHRGHPLSQRWTDGEREQERSTLRARVVVNAGLWLEEPDVDALTRLHRPVTAIGPSGAFRDRLACAPGTWAPFNSQNTAIMRAALPAYLLFPHVGRYDDIWASYVVRHIADAFGDVVTYGAPLVRQKRNPHNYFKDFDDERLGMETTDVFLEALRACEITTDDYRSAFAEIASSFRSSDELGAVAEGFRLWADVFASIEQLAA